MLGLCFGLIIRGEQMTFDLTKLKKRDGSTPINIPAELDYYCPICHKTCKICDGTKKFKPIHDETLEFSEYEGFMWCPVCEIDIPSFLCLRANTKEKVKIYTERFIDYFKVIK